MAVLPESMNRLGLDADENFRILEQYINYMSERLEFSMASMGRTINGAGVSTAVLAMDVQKLQNDLAAVQGTVGILAGDVNAVKLEQAALSARVTDLETAQTALAGRVSAMETAQTALEARVTALETAGDGT